MEIRVLPSGECRCVYSETIALSAIGRCEVRRASHVEPIKGGSLWQADMGPVGGPILGPFETRSEALGAESLWLSRNWL